MLKKILCVLGAASFGSLVVFGFAALHVISRPADSERMEQTIVGKRAPSSVPPRASETTHWSALVEPEPGRLNHSGDVPEPWIVAPEPTIVVPEPTVVAPEPIVVPPIHSITQ
jgi:hypothetical protein